MNQSIITTATASTVAPLFPTQPRFSNLKSAFKPRTIAYRVELARVGGGALVGLFLSQLVYWHATMQAKHGATFDGWIYKTANEWEAETGLTTRELATARKKCRELGLIVDRRAGVCGTIHYFLCVSELEKQLTFWGLGAKPNAPKRQSESPQTPKRFSANANPYKVAENTQEISQTKQQARPVVVDSKESVPDPQTDTTPAERALIACGMGRTAAARLADAYPEPLILQQCEWFPHRKDAGMGALTNSVKENWKAPGRKVTVPETAQNGASFAIYSDKTPDKTSAAPRSNERDISPDESRAIELCLAKLPPSQLAYIEECRRIEGLPMAAILERDCNWEFTMARRAAAAH